MKVIEIMENRSEMIANRGLEQGAKDRQRQKLKGYKDFQKKKKQKSKAMGSTSLFSGVFGR